MIEKLETDRQKMRMDKQKFIFHVSETIDRICEFPGLYMNADKEKKAELIRKSVYKIHVNEESVELVWEKPMSFILNREVLSHFPEKVRKCNVMGSCRNESGTLNIIDDVCSMWELAFAA